MIKKISLLIASIIAIPFIIALFMKTDYSVEQNITINATNAEVFDYIKLLKNQDNFSKWAMMDPNMKKSYQGVDGTVGFVSAWDSENEEVGKGEQEIIKISEGKRIDFELRFLSPFEATSPAYMITTAISENTTNVAWGFQGHIDYPMNIMFLFMNFEQVIGDDLQTGLNNLKVIIEK